MAAVTETTLHLALQLPHPSNSLEDDVGRLRSAITAIDAKFALLDTLLGSNDGGLDTIQELVTAIKADVAALADHAGAGGVVHAVATSVAAGFMAAADKAAHDALKTKVDEVALGILLDPVSITPASNGQTAFTIAGGYLPGSIMVFLNGVKLAADDFTATTSPNLALTIGANTTDTLEVVRFKRALAA